MLKCLEWLPVVQLNSKARMSAIHKLDEFECSSVQNEFERTFSKIIWQKIAIACLEK